MWVLECDGDLLGYKRQWLCPGQTYTIGRSGQGDKTSHPIGGGKFSMSRKHLVLEVKPVASGAGLSTFARSEIKATDASKHGTVLDDGEQIKGCTVTLTQDRHMFTLGKCPHKFVVSWHPKIFTFSLSKQQRGDKKYMKKYLDKYEKYDVKTIDTFVSDRTTHVVSDKRNTSKSLLALMHGLHVVQNKYLQAVLEACSRDPNDPETPSPLEQDYDGNWPDPMKFVPEPANEPVKRESKMYAPDHRRKMMMTAWTVVVGESGQKDNLFEVISEGGGKLVYKKVEPKVTSPQEFVDAAGKAGAVVYVQPQANNFKGNEKWIVEFISKVEKITGYHTAIQNQFLDAIIMADMHALRRPKAANSKDDKDHDGDAQMQLITHPPAEKSSKRRSTAAKPTEVVPEPTGNEVEDVEEEPAPKGKPARSRSSSVDLVIHKPSQRNQTQKSQFTRSKPSQAVSKFDDSDDDFEPLPAPSASIRDSATQQQKGNRHVSQVAFVDDVEEEDEDDGSETQTRRGSGGGAGGTQRPATNISQTASSLRKRPATQVEEEEEEQDGNVMERILPGAAAMKKRRLEEEKRQQKEGAKANQKTIKAEPMDEDAPASEAAPKKKPTTRSRKKPPIEEDEVIKATKEIRRREEAEEAAKRAEADRMDADGELAGLKNLALVETFEIIPRQIKPVQRSDAYGDEGSRWDEKWNGRKNFKKFRRKDGTQTRMRRVAAPLLVELVEHKARDFGIGDDYWLEKRKGKENEFSQLEGTNSQLAAGSNPAVDTQMISSDSDSEKDELRFTSKSQPKTQVPKTQTQTQKATQRSTQTQSQAAASAPRSSRSTRSTNMVAATQETPTTTGGRSQTASKRTKPAAPAAQPKKKQKTSRKGFLAKNEDTDDGSEDELKFRF